MQDIISKRLTGVQFSYYSTAEIRKMSVKEITNPLAFDNLSRPLQNGLYDPAMGVSPYDRLSRCVTCGQEGTECPGHCGHIELLLPVYNPFLVERLLKLIRSKCFSCQKLRIPKEKLKNYWVIFTLIKLGYVIEAKEYKSIVESKPYRSYLMDQKKTHTEKKSSRKSSASTQVSRKTSDNTTETDQQSEPIEQVNSSVEKMLAEKKKIIKLLNIKKNKSQFENGINVTNYMNATFEEYLKEFWGSVNSSGKCPHCQKKSTSIRKEGSSKFFISSKGDENNISIIKSNKEYDGSDIEESDDNLNEESKSQSKGKFQKGFLQVEQDEQTNKKKQKYLNPMEIQEHIKLLWEQEKRILEIIYGTIYVNKKTLQTKSLGYKILTNGPSMFFLETVLVPPNRFRPENKMGDQTFLHGHTVELTKLIQLNQELRNMIVLQRMDDEDPKTQQIKKFLDKTGYQQLKENQEVQKTVSRVAKLADVMQKWLQIQDSLNIFLDATKAQKTQDREGQGIRQILEKKEGLFRMKMMGKRVNYTGRSVISPDPNLNTNEVGVPLFMAKKLTFPEHVNEYNVKQLRERIINGPFIHPGANFITEKGQKVNLDMLDEAQRTAIAKTLMNNAKDKIVYRHLESGDVVLFNRQPTLHKPSLMSHIVRVLPKEQTIRMHYANCKSYNADFDGDEMNIHFLQSHLARAEGYQISLNDNNFISGTNGKPLRELMQDSIISAIFMTYRGTFYTKSEYSQLLYIATHNSVAASGKQKKVRLVPPCIKRPQLLWSGKQLLSNIIKIIVDINGKSKTKGLCMQNTTKLSKNELIGTLGEETDFIIRDNEILVGILDKNQVGSGSSYGMMHAIHELYGPKITGQVFTAFAKVLSANLQQHGFTCGLDDLIVDQKHNDIRLENLKTTHEDSIKAVLEKYEMKDEIKSSWNLYNRSDYKFSESGKYNKNILKRVPEVDYITKENNIVKEIEKKVLFDETTNDQLDMIYKSKLSKGGSNVIKNCLAGLNKPFPMNCFTTMTRSGAKGSMVNHSQVSALLGQQVLEGKRVPIMSNGKTLPCFLPYDPNPRAGGFIGDRFLSGLRPPEFYFHCMAGREGLVDTAVKTSRSGYLQRCLMKHLEGLKVNYDYTVRDGDSSIIQFYYGEDAIDTTKTAYLEEYNFLAENFESFSYKYDPFGLKDAVDATSVSKFVKNRKKADRTNKIKLETIQNKFLPGKYLGAVSEKVHKNIKDFIKQQENQDINIFTKNEDIKPSKFRMLANVKYLNSLIHPGDAVGCNAAMGIGEPSTQMTLNTFHLAGHGGANLTLGIPRLREILMTASEKIGTPVMILQFLDKQISQEQAEKYARKLKKINLLELVKKIKVTETKRIICPKTKKPLYPQERAKIYQIDIEYEDPKAIKSAFGISQKQIQKRLEKIFLPNLTQYLEREKKKDQGSDLKAQVVRKIKEGQGEYDDMEEVDKNFENHTIEESAVADTDFQTTQNQQETTNAEESNQVQEKKPKKEKVDTSSEYIETLTHDSDEGNSTIIIKLPLDFKKILMVNIVNKLLNNTIVREVKGINNTAVLRNETGDKNFYIQTEGVNFSILSQLDFIDAAQVDSNDIHAIMKNYGIEAARNAIIKEVIAVFSVYGVKNDPRHMALIADFMTFAGKIRGMNRGCIEENISPFLKMSYETCAKFLTNASLYNESDNMLTPSAQIVLGQVPTVGTGAFDVLHNFNFQK